jgi:hypothetical protein
VKRALLLLVLSACSAKEPAPAPRANVPSAPARTFGAPLTNREPVYPVDALLADPEPFVGKSIACRGTVARVCQAAGCWLELQAEGATEGLRVPMAAHAFFIPQDAVGHAAVIEGELKRHELPEAQRAHYAGEGMKAMGPLSLEATSVALW